MKTFYNLVFKKEYVFNKTLKSSKLFFENGWGVSVISGDGVYGDVNNPYELAVLIGNENNFHINYDNELSNGDVIGWLNKEKVTELMIKFQNFN